MDSNYHQQLPTVLGSPVAALMVAGMVGPDTTQSLLAWMDLSAVAGQDLVPFQHALEMEDHYLSAILDFDEPRHPVYGDGANLDLRKLGGVLDVDRLLCLVVLTSDGRVLGARSYENVEMTQIEALHEQYQRIGASLEARVKRHAPRKLS